MKNSCIQRLFVSFEELYEAYLECRKHKRNTTNAAKFEINAEYNLYKLWKELNSGEYIIGKSITFCVTHPTVREIFAADFRDRIIHHLIINQFKQYFEAEFIGDSYSCRDGKGVLYGVRRLHEQIKKASNNYTEDCIIIKGDFKSFFMNINKDILYKIIREIVLKSNYDPEIILFYLSLIKLVIYNCPQKNCTNKSCKEIRSQLPFDKSLFNKDDLHGLPIGNLTSQIFANLYLASFDKFVKTLPGVIGYGRYVDDFFIIVKTKQIIPGIMQAVKEELAKIEVTLHPNKIYIQHYHRGVKFIGAVVKKDRIYISNRTKNSLYKLLYNFNEENHRDFKSLMYYMACINSYLGFMIHYNTFNIRRRIEKSPQCGALWYHDKRRSKILVFKNFCPAWCGKKNYYLPFPLFIPQKHPKEVPCGFRCTRSEIDI